MNSIKSERLLSLDALRGFDMFWIIGAQTLLVALAKATQWGWMNSIADQMEHVEWAGFHFYDLIFPLFIFISGVSIPFALLKKKEAGVPMKKLIWKVVKRALILFGLGLVYNGFFKFNFATQRIPSVLSQIGFAYLIAALIILNTKSYKIRLVALLSILIGYALVQLYVPVPGSAAGVLTQEGSINSYIDRFFLYNHTFKTVYDPEGILCIISASVLTLLGSLCGELLRNPKFSGYKKTSFMASIGIGLILIALLLNYRYPIIKALWTSSFNLLTGGISMLLLALFYLVIDVWKYQKWSFFFRVIGLNSITMYLMGSMINFKFTSTYFFDGLAKSTGSFEQSVIVAGVLALEWLTLYFLYKKEIFLKV
ncbi:MAG: DUF5009 domain-containing protein [Bacteroidota bacterium]|nr:DUF5009 domain-containing protein [Bacteroidota bacterium]